MISKDELLKEILKDVSKDMSDEEVIRMLLDKKLAGQGRVEAPSTGEKTADQLAKFAGSWTFIILFMTIITIWIAFNMVSKSQFDPFPFILLNLILSCVAALQAPVIMMSQNRQETKDRKRAENDYRVNLKTEIIIEDIHKKIEVLIKNQEVYLEQVRANKTD